MQKVSLIQAIQLRITAWETCWREHRYFQQSLGIKRCGREYFDMFSRYRNTGKRFTTRDSQLLLEIINQPPMTNLDTENKTVEYWEKKLWQIIRYHNSQIRIDINFSPDFSYPTWSIRVLLNKEDWMWFDYISHGLYDEQYVVLQDKGTNLWKRLRNATLALKKLFGDNAYVYKGQPVIK